MVIRENYDAPVLIGSDISSFGEICKVGELSNRQPNVTKPHTMSQFVRQVVTFFFLGKKRT